MLAIFLLLLLVPATAGARPRADGPAAHAARVAARHFAPFRHAPQAADRLPRIATIGRASLRRLQRSSVRRMAAGAEFEVLMAVGPAPRRDPRVELLYLHLAGGRPAAIAARTTARLSQVVRDGALVSERLPSGMSRTVIVVPDGTRDAHHVGATIGVPMLSVFPNAIVVAAPSGHVEATGPHGRDLAWPLPLARESGTPVRVDVLPESSVRVDVGQGRSATFRFAGSARGAIPGGFQLDRDNRIVLGDLGLSVANPASTGAPCGPTLLPGVDLDETYTRVLLDPDRSTTAVLAASGEVTVDAAVILRAVLDLRGANGCMTARTPFADSPMALHLHGRVASPDGTRVELASDPTPVTLNGCALRGSPGEPCPQPAASVPATVTVSVVADVGLGSTTPT